MRPKRRPASARASAPSSAQEVVEPGGRRNDEKGAPAPTPPPPSPVPADVPGGKDPAIDGPRPVAAEGTDPASGGQASDDREPPGPKGDAPAPAGHTQDGPKPLANDPRVDELEQRLEELNKRLADMGEPAETPHVSGMDERMNSLLQLSEILSVRYNPFLDDSEDDLFDNRDVRKLLPKRTKDGRGEVVPVDDDELPGPVGRRPAAVTRAPTGLATDRDDGSFQGPADADSAPSSRPQEEPAGESPADATDPLARLAGPSGDPRLEAIFDDVAPRLDPKPPASDEAPQADGPKADEDRATGVSAGQPNGPVVPEVGSHDAPPAPEQRNVPPQVEQRSVRPEHRPSVQAPAHQSYLALCWFERLARQGDPSEIHLFVDHYASLGWIPAEHVGWMQRLAEGVAPRRDDLDWGDFQLAGVDLARLHRDHLRFLQGMFHAADAPEAWDRLADGLLGDD